jgi:LPXTG-motif cell wall-anchored protein
VYRAPTGGAIGGAGGLAFTGANVSWWIALGIVLLVAGLLLMHAARRRRRLAGSEQPSAE